MLLPNEAPAGAGTQDPSSALHLSCLLQRSPVAVHFWSSALKLAEGSGECLVACGVDVTRTSLDFVSPTQLSGADTNSLMFQTLSSGFSCHLYSFHGSALNCLLLLGAQTMTAPPWCFLVARCLCELYVATILNTSHSKLKGWKSQSWHKFNKSRIRTSYGGLCKQKRSIETHHVTTVCTLPLFIH